MHNDHRTEPAQAQQQPALVNNIAPPATGHSPLMRSSLPRIAAGSDLRRLQFEANGRLPQRTFLPVGL